MLEQVCSFAGPSWPHPDPCRDMSQRTDHSYNTFLSSVSASTAQTRRQPLPPQDALQAAAPWPSPMAQPHGALMGPSSPMWQTIPYPGETAHNGRATLGKASIAAFAAVWGEWGPNWERTGMQRSWTFTGLGCTEVKYLWCLFCFFPSIQKLTYRHEFQN